MNPALRIYALIVLLFYALFTSSSVVHPITPGLYGFACLITYNILSFGLALELADLLFAVVLPPPRHTIPRVRSPVSVAVLYLCCDDIDLEALPTLRYLRGIDVFILDDSITDGARTLVNASGFSVVRRADKIAFKAGNLNHWIEHYSGSYSYFMVLDSDSIISNEVLWDLVAYAELQANSRVAIVQPLIIARGGNRFQQAVAGLSLLRQQVLLRVYSRLGWVLSQGHNSLHRVAAIREVGGFDLSATCEDTVTSIRLLQAGWRIDMVELITFDAEPPDVFAYRGRSVRWARQTMDAILAIRGQVNLNLSLLLARHLLGYLLSVAWLIGLVLLSAGSQFPLDVAAYAEVASGIQSSAWLSMAALSPPGGLIAIFVMRACLWQQTGHRWLDLVRCTVVCAAVVPFTALNVTSGLLQSALIGKTAFTPTGMLSRRTITLAALSKGMALPWALAALAVMSTTTAHALRPNAIAIGLLVAVLASPLILFCVHSDARPGLEK
jgi:cellulose synthase/poly-beta-1,6-N-acetylglucosamine synthase-like glycosyltransferase